MKKILFLFLLFLYTGLQTQNLTRLGPYLKDDNSNNVILRGFNLGGWMLQEPYMLQFVGAASSQHEFKQKLVQFIGQENSDNFYQSWLDNFITEADIQSLASLGFNSVRLPMHYNLFTLPIQDEPITNQNTWINTGFDLVDNLLDWCSQNNMYLILDLHAAPGGQGYGSDINDYNPNLPSLWESEENKNKTIALWGELADRYKDEPWIGGYDLLNETHWPLQDNELRNFYLDVTNEIRQYDQNHIIFIEGNDYANNFDGLFPPWDDNMVYSFHKYWSYNDSLDWITWVRNTYGVPLWMGEAGENSNQWFNEAIKMFEENFIGWAFWPWKKVESISAPYSINSNTNYKALIDYLKGDANAPTIENAVNGLMELAESSNIINNKFQNDVVDAMIRQVNTNQTLPFTENNIPGIIYAPDYDLGLLGYAYNDLDYATYHVSNNQFQAWNQGWQYRNDGVDIENSTDSDSNGYQVGFTAEGEWLVFTVNVEESGFYNLVTRYASTSSGLINYEVDGYPITEEITLYNTGSYSNFVNKFSPGIYLYEGTQKLKVNMITGGYNLSNFNFSASDDIPSFSIQYAEATENESTIEILLNHPVNQNQQINIEDFVINVNSQNFEITEIEISEENPSILSISLSENYNFLDEITVSMNVENQIESIYQEFLEVFIDFPVNNNAPERILIPGIVQAEDFSSQSGLSIEETSDFEGGYNIGYTDSGDFAEYPVLVTESGNYDIKFRVASEFEQGSILLQLIDDSGSQNLTQITLPVTGGWQSWETASVDVNLDQGIYDLRMNVVQPGFNLNWIDFEYTGGSMSIEETLLKQFNLYPNPTSDFINIVGEIQNFNIEIFDMVGKRIYQSKNEDIINIKNLDSGIYLLKIIYNNNYESFIVIKN